MSQDHKESAVHMAGYGVAIATPRPTGWVRFRAQKAEGVIQKKATIKEQWLSGEVQEGTRRKKKQGPDSILLLPSASGQAPH